MLVTAVLLFSSFGTIFCVPNFVLVLTDDQDILLNGMVPMRSTLELLAKKGKTFTNFYANTPICCPSRSTILTGKYAHNTGVVNNSIAGNCSSRFWQQHHESHSLAAILKKNGYNTFYAGKYLNSYGHKEAGGTHHIPKGYDWWMGLKGNSRYYNYTLSLNGTAKYFKDDYLTDLLSNYVTEFLLNRDPSQPFFMMIAPPACHAPFTPARRHEHSFEGTKAVRNLAFNYSSTDKHWLVRVPPRYLPQNVTVLDDIQRHRLESLLAVDELIDKVVKTIESIQETDNTYFVFTSDNGFHIGQFALPWDKRQPYETDIKIPFVVRGPNIPEDVIDDYPVSTVDLAPTIIDLADVTVPKSMDGVSFKSKLLSNKHDQYSKLVLVEYWGEGNSKTNDPKCPWSEDDNLAECSSMSWCKCQDATNNTYSCILDLSSTSKAKFCSFNDKEMFSELYDLTSDPFELKNIVNTSTQGSLRNYHKLLRRFGRCKGRKCHEISQ